MLLNLDEELRDELPVWRLITESNISKEEIERSYTFSDISRANAILDMKGAIESEVGKIITPKVDK